MDKPADPKHDVREFWNAKSCGEIYAAGSTLKERMDAQATERYRLEPSIFEFTDFSVAGGKDVLEVGVGMGADHLEWAKRHPRFLAGIDLTDRSARFTYERLKAYGFQQRVSVGDAENIPFPDETFDIVYSWGVIHCSPDTPRAVREIHRVLRPGGTAKVLIYHKYSMVAYMLWARYALFAGRPSATLFDICCKYLESPGTKVYSIEEARTMFSMFSQAEIYTELGTGDLLLGGVGQRHRGFVLSTAKMLYPRWLVKLLMKKHGMSLLITAKK